MRTDTWKLKPGKKDELIEAIKNAKADLGKPFTYEPKVVERLIKGTTHQEFSTIMPLFRQLMQHQNKQPLSESSARSADVRAFVSRYCMSRPQVPSLPEQTPEAVDNTIALLTMYVKFISLRREGNRIRDYTRHLPRTKKDYPVYDEVIVIKSYLYNGSQSNVAHEVLSSGIVDLFALFPPHAAIDDDGIRGQESPGFVRYIENEPSRFYQPITTYLNAFQPGNELVTAKMPANCDRLVIVADFASLRIRPELLIPQMPTVEHSRGPKDHPTSTFSMDCQKAENGIFIVDSSRPGAGNGVTPAWDPAYGLLAGDTILVAFPIDWNAVDADHTAFVEFMTLSEINE